MMSDYLNRTIVRDQTRLLAKGRTKNERNVSVSISTQPLTCTKLFVDWPPSETIPPRAVRVRVPLPSNKSLSILLPMPIRDDSNGKSIG